MEDERGMWFKVDDRLHSHPKAIQAGEAMALWVMAGSWCADHLTDGFVPSYMPVRLMGKDGPRMAGALLKVGLWQMDTRNGEEGYKFHQWGERQPTREDVEEQRAAAARRQAEWRERKRQQRARNGVTDDVTQPVMVDVTGDVTGDVTNGESGAVRNGLRGRGARGRRPDPTTKEQPLAPLVAQDSAQTIVGEWLDRCAKRPPKAVVGQVAKLTGGMLTEGIEADDIRRGMAAWMDKGLHPSALPSVVNETMNGRRGRGRATTDDRVAAGLELAARFEAEEQRAIGGAR